MFLGVLGLGGVLADGCMGRVVVFWSMGLWLFVIDGALVVFGCLFRPLVSSGYMVVFGRFRVFS